MATFNKFDKFTEDLAEKVHNLDTDVLNVYLTNAAPSVSADAIKTDLAEISTGNGYTGPVDTQNSTSRTNGVTSVIGVDVVITASGAVGPFQYVVLYNDTPTSPLDPLIGWWDYGSAISLANGETFTVNFGTEMLTIT
jgi:hypothetical protein